MRLPRATSDRAAFGRMYHPPSWVTGGLSTGDAEFLYDLVREVDARAVVEIGVAAGTSSAAILFALDTLPAVDGGRILYSLDVLPYCYFDAARSVGSAVHEMYPTHRARWTRGQPRPISRGVTFDLAFVDADHRHPWPLLDVLHLAPALRREAWVGLHDIRLSTIDPRGGGHGAEWVFDRWPFEKRCGVGDAFNVGAIRLPADLAKVVPVAAELIEGALWETSPPAEALTLDPVFVELVATMIRGFNRRRARRR